MLVPTLARCILAISISSRPQHDGLRGQSWSGLSSLSSLLFSPGTARTHALLTTKSLQCPREDCYTTIHHAYTTTTANPPTPIPTRRPRPVIVAPRCVPRKTRQSAQKLERRTVHPSHIIRYDLANARQYRPIALPRPRQSARSRLQPASQPIPSYATLLDSISNRPDPTLPHSNTPLKPLIAQTTPIATAPRHACAHHQTESRDQASSRGTTPPLSRSFHSTSIRYPYYCPVMKHHNMLPYRRRAVLAAATSIFATTASAQVWGGQSQQYCSNQNTGSDYSAGVYFHILATAIAIAFPSIGAYR
jgi:hypothetical protein